MAAGASRPRIADLNFRVFDRPVHPDWFAVRAHRRIVTEAWEADIRVIEGGHAIHWRADRFRLTEALTGLDAALPEPGILFHSNLRQERAARLEPAGGLEYLTSFEVERCDAEVFDYLSNEASLDGSRDALLFSFTSGNRMAPPAISWIRFEARAKGVSIHTFHTFPAERAIVRTHSLFESRLALPAR